MKKKVICGEANWSLNIDHDDDDDDNNNNNNETR